ncbi:hypothetical protein K438DRAFT_1990064 [Mycena galopus ATCC 62051]|nr:hypothetical protein K438DRAFT_1990064 [Mycena galopus ATCC 62051]
MGPPDANPEAITVKDEDKATLQHIGTICMRRPDLVHLLADGKQTGWFEPTERESERVEQARQTAFEEGRQVGEKDALTMDTFEVSFSAGKMDGIATGIELGRQEETQRWKDNGHFEDATAGALLRSPDTHSTTATPAISFHRSYYNSTSTTTLFCATTTRPRTTLEAFSRWALHSVGAFGMGLDAGTLGFGLESEVGNEDVALRRGADAVVRTDGSGGIRAD